MKRARIALLLVMAGTAIANAQEYRVEHSLGYSYSNIDIRTFSPVPECEWMGRKRFSQHIEVVRG